MAPGTEQSVRGGRRTAESAFGHLFTRVVTFRRMEAVSLAHSVIYLGLLVSAFVLGGPQPWTFILGLSHGIIWILMSLTAVAAVHFGVINLRLAVAIALLGCIAPFFGSAEFLRQSHQRKRAEAAQ
ncbi:MAG: hypothetical protein ACO3CR_05170 [Solirubrobacterales bacterium]